MLDILDLNKKILFDKYCSNSLFLTNNGNYIANDNNNELRFELYINLFKDIMKRNKSKYIKQSNANFCIMYKYKNYKIGFTFHNIGNIECCFRVFVDNKCEKDISFRFQNWNKAINFLINEQDIYLKICDELSKLDDTNKFKLRNSNAGLKGFRLDNHYSQYDDYYFIPKKDTKYWGKAI